MSLQSGREKVGLVPVVPASKPPKRHSINVFFVPGQSAKVYGAQVGLKSPKLLGEDLHKRIAGYTRSHPTNF
jgi:hypothetical protein